MSSGIGRMINKGSMEGSTSSPTIRVEIYNQTYNIRSDERTLRDQEIEERHAQLTSSLLETFSAQQR